MIETLAKKITTRFICSNIIKSDEREIYNYCVEVTVVFLINYLSLFVLAIVFKELLSTIIFILSFLAFRKICGGYHASSYFKCEIMSLSSYLLFIFIIKRFIKIFSVSTVLLLSGLIIIMLLSPIEDKNKPFTKKQYIIFKLMSRGLACLFIILFVSFEQLGLHNVLVNKYYFSFCYGIDLVAFSLLVSELERRIKNAKG